MIQASPRINWSICRDSFFWNVYETTAKTGHYRNIQMNLFIPISYLRPWHVFYIQKTSVGRFSEGEIVEVAATDTNHHKQTNQLPGATCFPSSCPLHNVGFFSDWEQTCRPSQVSFFGVVFLTKGKPTNMSWWFGKDDDDPWGFANQDPFDLVGVCWKKLVTNKMFHTHPKLTWIQKMAVWKR